MGKSVFVLVAGLCSIGFPHFANAQQGTAATVGSAAEGAFAMGGYSWKPSEQKAIDEIISNGRKLGYRVVVSPADFGTIDVKYSKIGKTSETFGLLAKKWDQRETINVLMLPTDNGLKVTFAKRIVEQKAPIGDWKTVAENSEIPAELLPTRPLKN